MPHPSEQERRPAPRTLSGRSGQEVSLPNLGDNPALESYLAEVRSYPALNLDQQQSLFRHLRSGASLDDLKQDKAFREYILSGDERYGYAFQQSQTFEELAFRCSLGLVVAEARKYPRLPTLELIQEGNVGLMRAIAKHNPDLGKFTSYARIWIRGSMLNAMPDLIRPMHVPRGMLRRVSLLRDIEEELIKASGTKPSEAELRQEVHARTGLSNRSINTIFEVMSFGLTLPISLDRNITPDSDANLYNFIPDEHIDVEREVLNNVENEEYKNRQRPSIKEAAANMGVSTYIAAKALKRLVEVGLLLPPRNMDEMVLALLQEDARLTKKDLVDRLAEPERLGQRISIPTVQRSTSRLVDAKLIPPRPSGPRAIGKDGRKLDDFIAELLQQHPDLMDKELVPLLADPARVGRRIAIATINKSRLRLAALGKAQRRIMEPSFYVALDTDMAERLKTEATIKQIAEDLKQPKKRIQASGTRLRKAGKATSRATPSDTKAAVKQYLEEHPGEKINRSKIAKQVGVTRERVRQLYDDLTKDQTSKTESIEIVRF